MEVLNKQQVVAQFTISERTLETWVKDGKFPKPARIGKHAYWSKDAVDRWKAMAFAFQLDFKPR